MQTYEYKLDVFEGPLDLLLHLIEKNKIDIYHIPIVKITSQYMDFLHNWNHFDIQYSSEFLVMAATLLQIKSRMLLPKNSVTNADEEDPRDELVHKLIEFKHIKELSEILEKKMADGLYSFERLWELSELGIDKTVAVNLEELMATFKDVQKRDDVKVEESANLVQLEREEFHVEEVAYKLLQVIVNRTSFRDLLIACKSQKEQVATFLAVLELLKSQNILVVSGTHDVKDVVLAPVI